MSDVFISYSRRDGEFVRRLHDALAAQDRDVWVDWEDIPATADWWNEIRTGIDSADTFLFVITPDSVASDICHQEIDHALSTKKRFVPILHRQLTGEEITQTGKKMHAAISSHNWIYFQDEDNFDKSLQTLLGSIDTDLSHVREHTRLLVRAREWERLGRGGGYLLDSAEVHRADEWLAQAPGKRPEPTELHIAYIVASRAAHSRRQRRLLLGVTVAFVVSIVLAIFGFIQSQIATSNANTASTAQVVAQFQADRAQTQAILAENNAATATIAQGEAQVQADNAQTQAARAQREADSNATAQAVAQNEANNAATQAARAEANAITATLAQGQAEVNALEAQAQAAIAQREADSNATAQAVAQNEANNAATQAARATVAQGQAEISANEAQTQAAIAQNEANANATAQAVAVNAQATAVISADNAQTQAAIAQSEANANATAQAVAVNAQATAVISADNAQTQAAIAQNEANGNATAQAVAQREADLNATAQGLALIEANNAATQAARAEANAITATLAQGRAESLAVTAQAAQATAIANEQQARAQSLAVNGEQLLNSGFPDLAVALGIEASNLNPHLTMAQRLLNRAAPFTVRLNLDGVSRVDQEQYRDRLGRDQVRDVPVYSFGGLFDPTSTYLVTSLEGTGVSLIDLATREEVHRLIGHRAWVTTAVFSPDGRYLVSGSEDGDLIVWDVAAGTLLRRLSGHTGRINSLAYNPTSAQVVSGSSDGSAILWNVDSGEAIFSLPGFGAPVTKVVFNDNGTLALAFAVDQDAPKVGRLTSGGDPNRAFSNLDQYRGFNPRGNIAYTGGDGSGYLTLWRADSPQQLRTFTLGNANEDYIPEVAFSPDGRSVLVYVETRAYSDSDTFSVRDRFVELWDIGTGERRYRLSIGEPDPNAWAVYSLAFSPDSNLALIGGLFGRTNALVVWDVNVQREVRRFTGHNRPITDVAFAPDMRYAYSTAEDNTRVWDVNERETTQIGSVNVGSSRLGQVALGTVPSAGDTANLNGIPLSSDDPNAPPQDPVVFGYTGAGVIGAWNIVSNESEIVPINVGSSPLAFSPTRPHALVASTDQTNEFSGLRLWDMTTAEFLWEDTVRLRVTSLAYGGDGRQVVYGGYLPFFPGGGRAAENVYSLIVWDVDTRDSVQTIEMPDDLLSVPIVHVALSHDDTLAAALLRDEDDVQTLIVWEVATGAERWRVTDFIAPVNAIAFNPNGRTLAVALGQTANTVDVYDVTTGDGVLTLIGHAGSVNTMAFSPDGETMLTGSEDKTLELWDMTNGQPLRRFQGHSTSVKSVAFSADGHVAISAADRDGVFVWRIETLQETIDWTYDNRYVVDLSCLQRAQYNVQPICIEGVVPSPTPTGTLPPSPTPTITPTPTVTPTATATPIPYGYIGTTQSVNFREGPGSGFAVLRGLVPGTTFIVLEQRDDWMRILLEDGTEGWVSSSVVIMGTP
jgi:WD40 repeat protein